MNNINFLDCTLRDGGYINDWRFGNLTIRSVVARLDAAGIDFIEVGFLDSRKEYDDERSMFPDIPSIAKTLGELRPKCAKLVAMIDYGTFDEDLLIPAAASYLYGIRLIFTKDRAKEALIFGKKIKGKGYHLFLNLVSTSSYNDDELMALGEEINGIEPTAVSIVDTYGLMLETDMINYAMLLDKVLLPEIALGYHSHNNLQMSNANCIEFIKLGFKRNIIIDSSLLGMGKNAGNACTELVLSYANNEKLRSFDIAQVLECAYIDIGKFQEKSNWGYRLEFLMSAIMRCSPNWTKHYMKNRNLSIKDICNLLMTLPSDKKYLPSFFRPELAEHMLEEYTNKRINDAQARKDLQREIQGRTLLLMCPGTTIQTHREMINAYIEQKRPLVISVNFISHEYKADYVWISNSVRYSQVTSLYADFSERPEILLTSNITPLPVINEKYIFNFKTLHDQINGSVSAALLLELLLSLGAEEITFAGFDGYSVADNYFDSGYQLSDDRQSNERIAEQLRMVFNRYDSDHVSFLTPSRFEQIIYPKH